MKPYNKEFLQQAHKQSIHHESQIKKSKLCGCFHCQITFEPIEIVNWTDESSEKGKTAICPNCGIDAVMPDELPIEDEEFLQQMNRHWF